MHEGVNLSRSEKLKRRRCVCWSGGWLVCCSISKLCFVECAQQQVVVIFVRSFFFVVLWCIAQIGRLGCWGALMGRRYAFVAWFLLSSFSLCRKKMCLGRTNSLHACSVVCGLRHIPSKYIPIVYRMMTNVSQFASCFSRSRLVCHSNAGVARKRKYCNLCAGTSSPLKKMRGRLDISASTLGDTHIMHATLGVSCRPQHGLKSRMWECRSRAAG